MPKNNFFLKHQAKLKITMPIFKVWAILFIILLVLIDLGTKQWIEKNWKKGFLNTNYYVLNAGFAFGTWKHIPFNTQHIIYNIVFILTFINLIFNKDKSPVIALAFVYGGGMGNYVNKIISTDHSVIDFIPIGKTVANIADIFVFFGLVLFVIYIIQEIVMEFYNDFKNKKAKQLQTN